MIDTRIITRENSRDINIKNEPFELWGRMLPSYVNGKWDYTTAEFDREDITEMCFPDENYDFEKMQSDSTFIGAYDGSRCIGLAIMQEDFFKYMYLYDLKVAAACRGKGVGKCLIERAAQVASAKGYRGIYTRGQDNNLSACLFYAKNGFHIGGLDTDVYRGTNQEGKSDILFYMDIMTQK
jgi:ribosomal protein S18 acetylase RimI-like enzyme